MLPDRASSECSDGLTLTRNGCRPSAQNTADEHVNRHQDDDACKDDVERPSPSSEQPRDWGYGKATGSIRRASIRRDSLHLIHARFVMDFCSMRFAHPQL
jgi:hypothetical protein